MIKSFRDKEIALIFRREYLKKFPSQIQRTAFRKLDMLDWAATLDDLRVPPGNRLEALKGNRKGQHSIRINNQWRICFSWQDEDAHNVEITDYH
jgi:proteic killer suppression protein